MTQVLAAGIAVLDCLFKIDQLPDTPDKHVASDVQWVVGGCAANAAIAISRLGGKVQLAAQLGDDIAGNVIRARMQDEGINLDHVLQRDNCRSSVSSVFVDAAGERQIVNFRGDLSADGVHPAFNAAAHSELGAVLADTRWQAGAEAALTLARELGVPGVLDAEPPIPESLLQQATHVAFSRAGLLSQSLSGAEPDSTLADALLEVAGRLPAWVCVTDGERGVYSVDGNAVHHHPAYPVEAVDTLGAGDVWHGAFTLQLAGGASEHDSIQFANAVAALKCSRAGGGEAAPELASVQAFMR